jgi:hypothetical protein
MQFHTHKLAVSTWNHAGLVEKNPYPHPNRRQKTMQQQNRTAPTNSLVAPPKPKHPHKEQKLKNRKTQRNQNKKP